MNLRPICPQVTHFPTTLIAVSFDQKEIYYGSSWHSKELVDAMSGFHVKRLVRNAATINDFFDRNTDEIHTYLTALFKNDNKKNRCFLPEKKIRTESNLSQF